jgi:type VI secretion system protein ImpC
MQGPRDLSKIFETDDYAKWRSFRASEDARYIALCLPHTLMRLPYDRDNNPVAEFPFVEEVNGTDSSKYLWGNAAYAFASRLTEAFARHHWCAAIRGVEGGGLVAGLPAHTFKTDEGDIALKCPTEIAVTERRERELASLGFITLVHCKGTDYAAFFSAQSAQAVRRYDKDTASANARLATQLPYIFATSRIAHYLKAMMRDKIGEYGSRVTCERALNAWISQYVTPDDNASPEVKAQFPFREANIHVVDVPGKPGVYKAVAFLRPHFQLDELTISLRLVAELPQSAQR